MARSDDGGEFFMGISGKCVGNWHLCIKEEITRAKCPTLNGVAETALGVIHNASLALAAKPPSFFHLPNCHLRRPSELREHTGRVMPSTTPRRCPTQVTSQRTRYCMVRQHLHHCTRFVAQIIAAETARQSRSSGARLASTSCPASTTPTTHCGC